ncbi:MAG: beta-ketoacyl synthase [Methylophilaceae bacterium 17-44-8]|nr:MAG: beta-ketoacyl synthase [Methylophilaceae bacterium 17-44-8]
MKQQRRVVVTGFGVVSPLGNTVAELAENAFSGKSGVKQFVGPYVDKLNCKVAAQADFDPANHFDKKSDYAILDRVGQMALHASKQAVMHAHLNVEHIAKDRTGVYVGTGMGGIHSVEDGYQTLFVEGENRLKPYTVLMCMYNSPAAAIATHFSISGPNLTFSTACSSSSVAIGQAMKDIRYGEIDVALAGGTDAILTYASIKSWEAIRTLAEEDKEDISATCKPFSADRSGLVIGEGAATLILEELSHAQARGAHIYAEIIGYGAANDFKHIAVPSVEGQAAAMQKAIDDAKINPQLIQYINAHGTGTKFNDETETNAIKQIFSEHANQLAVSSTKSMHGHLMGAAGALEAIITLLAMQRNELPPTINLKKPDPKCDLNYVANLSQKVESLEYAMSNSFAFGGTGATLIFKKSV